MWEHGMQTTTVTTQEKLALGRYFSYCKVFFMSEQVVEIQLHLKVE
jgi:hypothetical protein